jgi:Zn ribbon nucleic-acid-binding protein
MNEKEYSKSMSNITCKICNGDMTLHDTAQILNKYTVEYYHCLRCGFIQTEEPYWLDEVYLKRLGQAIRELWRETLRTQQTFCFFLDKFRTMEPCLDFENSAYKHIR